MKLFGEDSDDGRSLSPFITAKPPSRQGGAAGLPAVAPKATGKPAGMDTPRGFEEELTEDEILRLELEKVKNERNVLIQSIAAMKAQAGGALGGGGG